MDMNFNPSSLDETAMMIHELRSAFVRAGFTRRESMFIIVAQMGAKVDIPVEELTRKADEVIDRLKDDRP